MTGPLRARRRDLACRELDGEMVILDLASSSYFALNPTGTLLWPALSEGASHGELVELLRDHFDLSLESATSDVDAFVDSLREHGLLED